MRSAGAMGGIIADLAPLKKNHGGGRKRPLGRSKNTTTEEEENYLNNCSQQNFSRPWSAGKKENKWTRGSSRKIPSCDSGIRPGKRDPGALLKGAVTPQIDAVGDTGPIPGPISRKEGQSLPSFQLRGPQYNGVSVKEHELRSKKKKGWHFINERISPGRRPF